MTDIEWLTEVDRCTNLLETLVEDYGRLSLVDADLRKRLLTAAGRLSRPDRLAQRQLVRGFRQKERGDVRRADQAVLDRTGLRALRRAPVYPTPLPDAAPRVPADDRADLLEPRKCYVCKATFHRVHFFYDAMCEACGDFNWAKRHQTADLTGRVALVTGARVKIGYHAAIMLLRAGAQVIATTRFPRDAARRYAAEPDFATWKDRLAVYGVDLRHTPSVEIFRASWGERGRLWANV